MNIRSRVQEFRYCPFYERDGQKYFVKRGSGIGWYSGGLLPDAETTDVLEAASFGNEVTARVVAGALVGAWFVMQLLIEQGYE